MKEQSELVQSESEDIKSTKELISVLEKEVALEKEAALETLKLEKEAALEKLKKVFPNKQESKADENLLDFNENGEPILSIEQQEELNFTKVNTSEYHRSLSEGLITNEIYEKREKNIRKFGDDLEKEGVNPLEYLLWHIITGSGSHEGLNLRFDLPDKRIWNFIKVLYGVE